MAFVESVASYTAMIGCANSRLHPHYLNRCCVRHNEQGAQRKVSFATYSKHSLDLPRAAKHNMTVCFGSSNKEGEGANCSLQPLKCGSVLDLSVLC